MTRRPDQTWAPVYYGSQCLFSDNTDLSSDLPGPALPRIQAPHLSRPGSVTATKIKQVFSYWSDPHHPASHCTDSSPCVQGSHWFIWSQVSALGQWQPASHCNTILSIRTAEKEHVGPQLSQVYKTMLLKFHSISKTYDTKMTCKVILKPQWWSLVQNSVKRSNCCQVIFVRVLCQWWAVAAAVQTQQWRSQWGKLGLKIRLANPVIWRLWMERSGEYYSSWMRQVSWGVKKWFSENTNLKKLNKFYKNRHLFGSYSTFPPCWGPVHSAACCQLQQTSSPANQAIGSVF